jgi:transketolase
MVDDMQTTTDREELLRLISLMTGDEKHDVSATSTLDVLWVLYDRILKVDPTQPDRDDRDRFLLSKGHGPMAYYAVLAAKGFLPVGWLAGFGTWESPLGHHPDRTLVPGVEISSGSLGHGLPLAVGVALGLRAQANSARIVVLVGDAELDEGSNEEAILFAGRAGLDRLTAVVIDNTSSTHGWYGGIERRFEIEGWTSSVVGGRDHDGLEAAFHAGTPSRPHVVIARTEPKRSAE